MDLHLLSIGISTRFLRLPVIYQGEKQRPYVVDLHFLGDALLGGITGALIGQETESGFVREAAAGTIFGVVFSRLKDKYHPTNLLSVIKRRNEAARKLAKDFLPDLHSRALDLGPGVNDSSSNKSGQSGDPNSDSQIYALFEDYLHAQVVVNAFTHE